MMDAFGPEGLDIADQFRAVVEVGGIMNDDIKCCAALLMEVEQGLTPPGSGPDFKVDPDLLRKETRKIFYCSCACFNDIVLPSGRMIPHKPVFDTNALALHDHMQHFTAGRISIGDAEDWQIHTDFNGRAWELEHEVVTGRTQRILASWDDTNLADDLGHQCQINPKCTLRKMTARDTWHKAKTTDNSVLFT
jgi:hypothetical protein